MPFPIDDLPTAIRTTKAVLRAAMPNRAPVFRALEGDIARQADAILTDRAQGRDTIPVLRFADIAADRVDPASLAALRTRGACVIRGVFDARQASDWNDEIAAYVEANRLDDKLARRAEDRYFGTLASSRPQIYGIYWSKPQIAARQSPALTQARVFLNRLWRAQSEGRVHFDPARAPAYADRIRRRPPGSSSLGLSPHVDGGSVERWLEPNYRRVYRHVLAGDWRAYDPFDAAFRPDVEEIPSPAVCSMFRTFQGWTALTPQGPGDGTLQLIPVANAMAYVVLRALQDDVPDDDLCGAQPGRALSVLPAWHAPLLAALVPIPPMEPGDAVFWHGDVVHAVEDAHRETGYSNVMYIASAPGCAKNDAYLKRQLPSFLRGESPPDFPADHFETDFAGRARADDLSALGREQMGFGP
ncbi:hypothetical protein AQ837_10970 [Burkholderia pseudomallei]|uniref:DUF1479 domain-containing protein n=1 Tax=Burkholderia pseudomallei TaxID=28450 RepID=UPI0003D8A5B0|nr:DUF1479 domain-containing protein [Burkholderia pseudomallei]AHE37395.1 putative cytoplasmic protein [Burkholderia pseudomallei NAU20B-16]AHG36300.1 hypothetical protein BBQ_4428 [Burkholderia pseudomallei MSHR511]AHG71530.1 putative cytoplasmic protein [Burkholderia pseudomallei MSHR146]KGW33557.1 hypothetical protein Y047_3606 [Burkholderia pseudomallei MSHR3016]OMX01218.1 hypothetical protein AQ819_13300 [Burkholderia pseudomallei]